MARYSYAMLFRDFRNDYPNKWRKGTSYVADGFMAIKVMIPGDGIYKYEFFGKKLTLIKKQLTPTQEKSLKVLDRRYKMEVVADRMETFGISQRYLSTISGVSRQSINKYMSGDKVPKLTTITKLEEAIEGVLKDYE